MQRATKSLWEQNQLGNKQKQNSKIVTFKDISEVRPGR